MRATAAMEGEADQQTVVWQEAGVVAAGAAGAEVAKTQSRSSYRLDRLLGTAESCIQKCIKSSAELSSRDVSSLIVCFDRHLNGIGADICSCISHTVSQYNCVSFTPPGSDFVDRARARAPRPPAAARARISSLLYVCRVASAVRSHDRLYPSIMLCPDCL